MLSPEARDLYIQLGMEADDDGYCEFYSILMTISAQESLVYQLATKGYLTVYEDYVLKITHWEVNNQLRKDRYIPSIYKDKRLQEVKDFGKPNGNQMATKWQPSVVKGSLGKERKKKSIKKESSIELPEWLNKEVWNDWVQHRKQKRNKLTDKTIERQIKLLEKHKDIHVAILEYSIQNGYQGLFPDKVKPEEQIKKRSSCVMTDEEREEFENRNPF
jgi:hypothetical protein